MFRISNVFDVHFHLSSISFYPLIHWIEITSSKMWKGREIVLRRSILITIFYCIVFYDILEKAHNRMIIKNFKVMCKIYMFMCAIVFYEDHYFVAIYFHVYCVLYVRLANLRKWAAFAWFYGERMNVIWCFHIEAGSWSRYTAKSDTRHLKFIYVA